MVSPGNSVSSRRVWRTPPHTRTNSTINALPSLVLDNSEKNVPVFLDVLHILHIVLHIVFNVQKIIVEWGDVLVTGVLPPPSIFLAKSNSGACYLPSCTTAGSVHLQVWQTPPLPIILELNFPPKDFRAEQT